MSMAVLDSEHLGDAEEEEEGDLAELDEEVPRTEISTRIRTNIHTHSFTHAGPGITDNDEDE